MELLSLLLLVTLFVAGLVVLVAQGIPVVLALQMPELTPADPSDDRRWPKVSVIVAARNEETDLADCLDGLLAQDYPDLEILVVDGGSTDASRAIAVARAPRVRLLDEPPLPTGWVGKNWACDVGFRASTGEWLLFTDADVRYHPAAVRSTVEWAGQERASLATLAPRVEMVGFWEKVVLPFYTQMVLTYFRTPRVNRDDSRAAMANGQYTLIRRAEYVRIGGHEGVRGAVLEDVALARNLRRAGGRMRVAWSPELLATRMYRDRHEMFEGLLKNVHDTEFSAARQTGFIVGLLAWFVFPFALLPLGILLGSLALALEGALVLALLFVKHAGFARGIRASPAYGLLFPLAVGFYLVLLVTSLRRGLTGQPVEWKGRRYALDSTGPSSPGNR